MLQNIEKLLSSQGFKTSDIYEQGSFDIVARKKLLILLLKIFQNIDSVNEGNAHEMKQLANIFLASPIIIDTLALMPGITSPSELSTDTITVYVTTLFVVVDASRTCVTLPLKILSW